MKKTTLFLGAAAILLTGCIIGYITRGISGYTPDGELPPPPPFAEGKAKHHKHGHNHLAKELGLSPEQRRLADENREAGRKAIEPLMQKMFKIREQMDKIREENMAAFEKILTPEQQKKFNEIKSKMPKPPHHKFKLNRKLHQPVNEFHK